MLLGGREIAPGTGHTAGRQLLGELYRQYTSKGMPPILLTQRGKPYFADSSLHFSITYTPKHVFCALSDCPVGIDAEEIDRDVNLRLAERILSPGEMSQYLAAEDKRLALLTFWVLKEAAAKASGECLQGVPQSHRLFSGRSPGADPERLPFGSD